MSDGSLDVSATAEALEDEVEVEVEADAGSAVLERVARLHMDCEAEPPLRPPCLRDRERDDEEDEDDEEDDDDEEEEFERP